MFCSRCGSEITGKSKFCPSCGLDLMATTPVHAIATGALQEMDLVREALAAEYEILEELGRGGMALVYRARDRQLEREVAIKVLPFSLAFDAEFVERFQREARTAAQLEHPNIIPIYRVGRAGRVIYFVMKYLRGGALSTVLTERTKLAPPEIRRLLVEAGSALGYAAQRGIVHRDIKPDNIMFDEFGQCLLTDFGIAKAATGQRLTGTGMSIGTPHYMSPEQARAQAIDGRSDLYSLGIVAYQCLTGSVPYDGEDSFSIGYKHITEPVPVPSLVTADERRVFELIGRMLMKEPDERFQSCEELLAALEGQPIAAPGSVRTGTGAAVGAARGSMHMAPAGAAVPALEGMGGGGGAAPPAIVSQPTTPMTSPLVDRRITPLERRDIPTRRLADRSVAMRSGGSWGWFWIVLAILGGAGGGLYYYESRGFMSGGRPSPAVLTRPDTVARTRASTPAGPAAADSSTGASTAGPTDTTAPSAAENPAKLDSTRAADSGGVRIVGLPRGSNVLIDERPVTDPVTKLAPGRHVLAISAPKYNFYTDTILIRSGQVDELTPHLTPLGTPDAGPSTARAQPQPARRQAGPGPAGDRTAAVRCGPDTAGNPCFDDLPKPVNPPFVTIPADTQASPTPSTLWVKVSTEGRTVDVKNLRPSNDSAFEREARNFAWTLTWYPALKDGAPIEAWTQMLFRPAQR